MMPGELRGQTVRMRRGSEATEASAGSTRKIVSL